MSQLYIEHGPSASGQKVMLATTVYDKPDASYVNAIASTREALSKAGIQSAYCILQGNCHVDDARNSVVMEFMASDCTDLFFLDADVSWQPESLVMICQYDRDLVGAVYPFRDPSRKADMPCRTLSLEHDADGLLEMDGLPTGFMRIRRKVFETLLPDAKEYRKAGTVDMMPILFERLETAPGERRSGDLAFCWKWRQKGGTIWADPEIRLGHTARVVVSGSLGQALRMQDGSTLRFVCDRIRQGNELPEHFAEVYEWLDNEWAAPAYVLAAIVAMARNCGGDIIETGSGLSTILMAAANPDHYVYCFEHDPVWAGWLVKNAHQAGVLNIGLCHEPLADDGWYDLNEFDLPETFAMGFCDGPPRVYGTRKRFMSEFGPRCSKIAVDDANVAEYAAEWVKWAEGQGRDINIHGRLAVLGKARVRVKASRKAA